MRVWEVHLTGVVEQGGRHSAEGRQQYRCADCGTRSCCNTAPHCFGTPTVGPFPHRWIPMGTGRTIFMHVKDS